ncbi:DnaD domain protein [Spiroplasma alleghenense]|uniref:Chromosome replication initiation and membrane attachment protein n=1 Tax=Spiroplasma alleghenense TaxID=216931 RepID=A0A345Z448_9MOLU|nr:DnaD domain protein [Spiroplasma alleghenense]AXK51377.1 chromosome replication initiation and membrane attachment protein [Spiroplasma alleghenense]
MENYSYKINLKNNSSNYDLKTLQYLYLPIIGSGAFSVFNCLVNEAGLQKEFKKKEFDISRLAKISSLTLVNLKKDIEKLSAMGLLKIMTKKDNSKKLFNVYAPLEPSEFLSDEIYSKALLKKIGKEEFEVVTYIFRDDCVSSDEYIEEKATFSKVFQEDAISLLDLNPSVMKLKKRHAEQIQNKISVAEIMDKLKEKNITINLNTVIYKSTFKKIASLYQLNTAQVLEAILICYDYENDILSPEVLFDFITVKNVEMTENNCDLVAVKKCREMEEIDPINYLELLRDGKTLTSASKNIIKTLQNDFKFNNGIINCLLEFSYYKNSHEIVGNYLIKIAQSVQDLKITKTIDLMNYLKQAHKESLKNNQAKKSTSKTKVVEKFKDIVASIDWDSNSEPEAYQSKLIW